MKSLRIFEKFSKNRVNYLNSLKQSGGSPAYKSSLSVTIFGVFVVVVAILGLITQDAPKSLLIVMLICGVIFASDIIFYIINIFKNRK